MRDFIIFTLVAYFILGNLLFWLGAWLIPFIPKEQVGSRIGVGALFGCAILMFSGASIGSVQNGSYAPVLVPSLVVFTWIYLCAAKPVIRAYYFLTPHPASRIMERALNGDGTLDVEAFAKAIQKTSGANSHEREVRAEQVGDITRRWREHEQSLRSREAATVAGDQRRDESINALLRAQTEALEAAIAHEKASARLEELRRSRNG